MKTIEFYSDIAGVSNAYPIVKPTEVLPKWVATVRADYKQNVEKLKQTTHLYRCPGIFDLFGHGFIIPAWHDIEINTDGENYGWLLPNEQLKDLMGSNHLAQAHSHKTIGKYLPRPDYAHPSVLKLNTPWHVIAPKGVKFLMTSVPYPDTFEFQALNGILEPSISSEINIQINWNIKQGKYIIKAGTPLAHLIPLTEKNYELVVREKNKRDELWSLKRKYTNSMSFILNRKKVKEMYEEHFNLNKKCPFHFWRK